MPHRRLRFLADGGALGALMRAHDWAATPLGPPEDWPEALKTTVGIMLGSRQPMYVAWGPARLMLYNDSYAVLCGARHPAALGKPFSDVWFDVMEDVGPIVDRAFAGEATHMDDIALVMTRNGYPEEAHFSFSTTPVRDEEGRVAGMFCACAEITARIMAERRQAFGLALDQALRDIADPARVAEVALRMLGAQLRVGRCGYAEPDEHGEALLVTAEWGDGTLPSLPPGTPLMPVEAAPAALPRRIDDAATDPVEGLPGGAASGLLIPIASAGRLTALLYVHQAVPRRWLEAEEALLREMAERIAASLARAQAEVALRASEARWRGLFAAMHEGFALCEMVRDEAGRDVDFRYLEVNDAWERLTGITRKAAEGQLVSVLIPGVEPFWIETYGRVVRSGEPAHVEYQVATLGAWFEVFAYRTEPGRFAAVFLNVTERKASEERQALLAREVDHRAKNALAVVLAALRLTRADSLPAYRAAVEGRVAALARAQTLLARENWSGAALAQLLEGELKPFIGEGQHLVLEGPPVHLQGRAVQPVAMAMHELATNATKHGALSVAGGRVSVSWRTEDGGATLVMRWRESGGPPAVAPNRQGFGSRVLEATLRGQLGGGIAMEWSPQGLACTMTLPLAGPVAEEPPIPE
ncbi:PAS domain-containing protein [Roseomonas stagni]|uniref:histidine kinase n=1 Tax=Falsiroseomonas algicola TaxID=2716930 RepID=A0A6M1LLG6_9PROT|nr:HWE histidine kinase domain-containing protein [Falsiroseomonas algicola]NGM21093.1 PAS domain-containing protein [Falsiroseomonas algicola]